jgi:hypothetical protein
MRLPSAAADMTDTLTPLILDMLEWISIEGRPYSGVMDAWRTSCPRLAVWEEANERGFLVQRTASGGENVVQITHSGLVFLAASGRVVMADTELSKLQGTR